VPRSICAAGHKWLWNDSFGGLPPEEFFVAVDPLLAGVRGKFANAPYHTSDRIAGGLSAEWASKLGLSEGIPIPVGAFDAHWDAIGAGVAEGDIVNVIGTATCVMAIAKDSGLVPGVCGVVPGSIHPGRMGIEAGLSACGYLFESLASRTGRSVKELTEGLDGYRGGQTGLLRLTWDNGDRTVLVNPNLGGVTLGWNLNSTAEDDLFAAIEGTAFHTRIILDRMREHGVPIRRVIHGGGIPQKNEVLNRVYASVMNLPVLVPETPITSLGSAIFAFLACGEFATIEDAQAALCPKYRTVEPASRDVAVYQQLYPIYRELYFAMGRPDSAPIGVGMHGVDPDQAAIRLDQLEGEGQRARGIASPRYPDPGTGGIQPEHAARVGAMDGDLVAVIEGDVGEKPLVPAHQAPGDQRGRPAHRATLSAWPKNATICDPPLARRRSLGFALALAICKCLSRAERGRRTNEPGRRAGDRVSDHHRQRDPFGPHGRCQSVVHRHAAR
jgi:hypothetical protein